jgi:hypothetical protein
MASDLWEIYHNSVIGPYRIFAEEGRAAVNRSRS